MGVRNPKAIAYNWITGQKDDPVQNTLISIPYSKQYKAPENDVVQEIIRIGEPGLSNGPPRSIEGEMLNGEQISYFQQQVGNTKIGGLRLEQALRKVMNSKELNTTWCLKNKIPFSIFYLPVVCHPCNQKQFWRRR